MRMQLLDMLFRRHHDEASTPESEAPAVPDRSGDIVRQTSEHVRAARGVVQAGVLSPQDLRVKRAFEATGRAVRATRK